MGTTCPVFKDRKAPPGIIQEMDNLPGVRNQKLTRIHCSLLLEERRAEGWGLFKTTGNDKSKVLSDSFSQITVPGYPGM